MGYSENFKSPMDFKNINARTLFLIDGLGALLSAILLGIVLVGLEPFIGMPPDILYVLAGIASAFAIFSLLHYWRWNPDWQSRLKIIAIANSIYCCLTIGLVVYYLERLTTLGIIYFFVEAAIIIALVAFEFRKVSGIEK